MMVMGEQPKEQGRIKMEVAVAATSSCPGYYNKYVTYFYRLLLTCSAKASGLVCAN
jgi:hypothetical protein